MLTRAPGQTARTRCSSSGVILSAASWGRRRPLSAITMRATRAASGATPNDPVCSCGFSPKHEAGPGPGPARRRARRASASVTRFPNACWPVGRFVTNDATRATAVSTRVPAAGACRVRRGATRRHTKKKKHAKERERRARRFATSPRAKTSSQFSRPVVPTRKPFVERLCPRDWCGRRRVPARRTTRCGTRGTG